MAEANAATANEPATTPGGPSRLGRIVGRVRPGKGALHAMGVLVLVAAAFAVVAVVVYGILATRTAYYEQRNLRELDRIAAELTTTRESLAQTAALHFVPQQLHFSLSRQLECLVATSQIMGTRRQPITITYYFTDPGRTGEVARWYANQTPPTPPASSRTPPSMTSLALPENICGHQRPIGLPLDETVTLRDGQIRLARTAQLTNLLWPMTAQREPGAQDLTGCMEAPDAPREEDADIVDLRSFLRGCFIRAAMEDMADYSYSYRRPDQLRQAVEQSIDAALASNTIRINVGTSTAALDLDSALEIFDAVQIIGPDPDHPNQSKLLLQAGRVPAAIEGDEPGEARALNTIFTLGGLPAGNAAAARAGPRTAGREGDFLIESRIFRTGDLILFQRTVPRLAGLQCSPCRIVGIVERSKFDHRVRKIDGVHATMFLIGILSLIGLIPLLQLKLRKRLDAAGRAGQHIMWFSLTLLAASATIACLAIWSAAASRNAGADVARTAIQRIAEAFDAELSQTLRLIGRVSSRLGASETVFPSPETLPRADHLSRVTGGFNPASGVPAVAALAGAWKYEPAAAIIDTVAYYRGDGFLDRDTARIAAGRFPAFGVNVADRPYFARARNRDFDHVTLQCAGERRPVTAEFILDRVFARPDGAARVVFVQPAKRACLRSPEQSAASGSRGGGWAAPSEADTLAPVHTEDQRTSYNPTRQEFVVTTGTLRTFPGTDLRPGFSYAVIDPDRPLDEANVLFHSRPGAEMVERFQQEIDDPGGFQALVREALTEPDPDAPEGEPGRPRRMAALRMDTNYRAQPARLTVARLHPRMDWILVIIEDRNDAGFAVWRAASFGYGIWFMGALIVALALVIGHIRRAGSLDRRPGLSLWPRKRLEGFTPPRLQRLAELRSRLGEAAAKRDRHIWWTLAAALIGVAAAEGGARVLFAFAAAAAALAARAYFQGATAGEDASTRASDRRVILAAVVLLVAAALAFGFAIAADYELRAAAGHRTGSVDLVVIVRILAFAAAAGLLARPLLAAWAHTGAGDPDPDRAPGWGDRLRRWLRVGGRGRFLHAVQAGPWRRLRRWLRTGGRGRFLRRLKGWSPRVPKTDVGWIVALIVMGGAPAAAGYLDSYDQDRFLLVERAEQVRHQAEDERRQAVRAVDIARLAKLPAGIIRQMVYAPLALAPPPAHYDTERCVSLSCIALRYLDLREQALEYSDFAPFHLGDAVLRAHSLSRPIALVLLAGSPLLALVLALLFFQHQYFRRPPPLSPGKDPGFDPPLSFTRAAFIDDALVPAATGQDPELPFTPAGGNRHLILGVDLDVRDDLIPGGTARVGDVPTIHWVDLLDPPAPVPADATTVVIGNLDLALQLPDEAKIRETFTTIQQISAAARGPDGRQVFLLADIDPLDRIALLWERQEGDETTRLVEGWRWAELFQDFTMFPIRSDGPIPIRAGERRVLRVIREELSLLQTSFAHELRDQLYAKMKKALARNPRKDSEAEADRMTSFIAEQMSDHYYKLWASSSDEERVMLYRVARDCFLKMEDLRALRSLLARGLLVRVPEYRLMNRSFTRYVGRVGEASGIRSSAERVGGVDRVWPLIRYPLAALAGSAVLLLQFVAPSASGAVGALPALLALLPAMLGRWFQDRTGAA